MKTRFGLLFFALSTAAFAHPGGGIIALSENSAIIADPVENFIWLVEKGQDPKRLVSKFHGHWLTRGLDGNVYAEHSRSRAAPGVPQLSGSNCQLENLPRSRIATIFECSPSRWTATARLYFNATTLWYLGKMEKNRRLGHPPMS